MKKIFGVLAASALVLSACSSNSGSTDATTSAADAASDSAAASGEVVTLTVGASPVPHTQILQYIDENLAADAGIDLEIVEYSDYVLPNTNLDAGELDANYFQHVPYFDAAVAENGYDFQHGDGIHIEPYGVYSEKVTSVADIPEGGTVSIVNDPSNQSRALWLLEDEGLITVDPAAENPTVYDITDNPKNIKFQEIEAPNLPRTLSDVDASVINGNFALEGGLTPSKDAIALEAGTDNPYANVLAWKTDSPKADAIVKLDELLHSPEVATYIEENWSDGTVIPAF